MAAMKANVLVEQGRLEMYEMDVPTLNEKEVLIRIKAVGLCGSDIHYYEHGKIGPYVVEKPIILGHEAAGEIVKVGSAVKHLDVGQRVTIEPGQTCGTCHLCKGGRYNLCEDVAFLATPPYDGAFCEYISMREDLVFPVPHSMSDETAALIEPFSVGLHAVDRGSLAAGETVVIIGMGTIGLMTALAAKLAGASMIIGVDFEENRLNAAKEFGLTDAILLGEEDLHERMAHLTKGIGADVAIETAGNEKAFQSAIASACRGGRVVIVGLPPSEVAQINVAQLVDNELEIRGVFRYKNTYQKAIKLIEANELQFDALVTGKFSLEETEKAFQQALSDKKNTMKLVIYPGL